jgi:flavin reductase (DIM6/NTAB) family NADH-FMN oxidoreductase RutF
MTTTGEASPAAGATAEAAALADALRRAMRGVAATVTIVTTEHRGERFGITASSFTSVSLEPPSVLVAINRDASLHDPLLARGVFAVNVLAAGSAPLARRFADSGLGCGERFRHGHWRSHASGLPLLEEAQTRLICRVRHCLEVGTHSLVVGLVEAIERGSDLPPLIYADGGYHHLPLTAA